MKRLALLSLACVALVTGQINKGNVGKWLPSCPVASGPCLDGSGNLTISGTVIRGGGTTLPATCAIGDQYFLTTGTTGNYQCTATNTWTLPGGGSGTAPYSCAVSGVSSIACTHSLNTSTPWVACYDGSGNMLGSTGASTSVTSVVATSANVATLTFSGTTTATCRISSGGIGPAGTNGTNGTNGSNGSAATIAVGTVSTGAAGSSVVITNSGTSSAATFNFTVPRGDTGAAGSGSGDASTNTSTSADGEITLFSGTNGKVLKRATGTGYVKVTSGVIGTPGAIPLGDIPSGVTLTIASGTATLGTGAITANACASVVTVSATGTATTDTISWTPNADLSGATGYGSASTDGLIIYPYPTSGNVNFKVCNGTGTSITPGAATLNWRVVR